MTTSGKFLLAFLLFSMTTDSRISPIGIVRHDGCRVDSIYFNTPYSGYYGDDLDDCA